MLIIHKCCEFRAQFARSYGTLNARFEFFDFERYKIMTAAGPKPDLYIYDKDVI